MAVQFDYDSDVQSVYEILTEPQYLVDRSLALGELSAECEAEEADGITTVSLMREVSRDLPRVLSKLFDSVQLMDMTETWREKGDGYAGEWEILIRGQPVAITARFELVPTRSGCRYSVTHKAKAKIPLVGKQVEKYILSQTADGARQELEYLRDYLD